MLRLLQDNIYLLADEDIQPLIPVLEGIPRDQRPQVLATAVGTDEETYEMKPVPVLAVTASMDTRTSEGTNGYGTRAPR